MSPSLKSIVLALSCMIIFLLVGNVSSAKILALFPYFGASHFFVFQPLLEGLALRGHSLHVLSHMPRKTPMANYRDVSIPKLLNETIPVAGFLDFSTMSSSFWKLVLPCLLLLVNPSSSAKILALLPYFGASHFYVFQPLLEGLALRGHSLHVLSYMPRKRPMANYKDISIPQLLNSSADTLAFLDVNDFDGVMPVNTISNLFGLWMLSREYERVHDLPEVTSLANGSYDLVLIEMFNSDLFFGIAYKTGAPVVGLSSCHIMPWAADHLTAPNEPSYVSHLLTGKSYRMSFFERVMNTVEIWIARAAFKMIIDRDAQNIAERRLGPLPPLSDIADNTSLLLVNTHFSFLGHRPLPPSVVEVGGLNLKPIQKLPADVEKQLNESSNGAIYFSMGSVLVGKTMSEKKKQMFVNALADIGKTVLWKWEGTIEPLPKNIITKSWFSQRDILQHPKIDLFISHCGNLGLTEAVDAGVPVLCIPMYGDQHKNAKSVEDIGSSIFLDFRTLTEDKLRSALNEILTNKRYKETAKRVQAAFRDRQMSPLDSAIYWVEYILKHGPVTRSPYADLPIWLREGYDVAAFLLLVWLSSLYLVVKLFKTCCGNSKSKQKQKQS